MPGTRWCHGVSPLEADGFRYQIVPGESGILEPVNPRIRTSRMHADFEWGISKNERNPPDGASVISSRVLFRSSGQHVSKNSARNSANGAIRRRYQASFANCPVPGKTTYPQPSASPQSKGKRLKIVIPAVIVANHASGRQPQTPQCVVNQGILYKPDNM